MIQPAPWKDGELLLFAVRLKTGKVIGDLTYSAEAKAVGGKKACGSNPS